MFSFFLNPSVIGERRDNEERERKHPANGCEKRGKKETHNNKPNTRGFCEKKSSLFVNVSCFYVSYFFRTFFSYTLNATRTKKGKSRTMGEREWNVLKMNSYETIFIDTPTHFGIIIFCFLFEKKTWTC